MSLDWSAVLHLVSLKLTARNAVFFKDITLAMESCEYVATALNNISALNFSGSVTDPSGTFITHTCPLFPLISTCISVPFGFHWIIVTMSVGVCEYLCCVFWLSCHCGLRDEYGSRPVC